MFPESSMIAENSDWEEDEEEDLFWSSEVRDEWVWKEEENGVLLASPSKAPCSRPLCKCADFGAVEPRNLGDFRSNFNGGEILRASLLLSPRLIFSSK